MTDHTDDCCPWCGSQTLTRNGLELCTRCLWWWEVTSMTDHKPQSIDHTDDIKPRIINGVGWCDAGCPQCEDYNDDELTAFCGIDGICRDAHHEEVEPTMEPEWQGNICPHHARRVTAERDELVAMLRAVLAAGYCPECEDQCGYTVDVVLDGYERDGTPIPAQVQVWCRWCHDAEPYRVKDDEVEARLVGLVEGE